jgi:hypothetical protein
LPKIKPETVAMLAVFLIAFGFLAWQNGHKSGAVTVGITGLPFSIWNGAERGDTVTFAVTATNTGNVPANISITDITGNATGVSALATSLKASIGNQPRNLEIGQSGSWASAPVPITAIPTGTYKLNFTVTGTNPMVEIQTGNFYYDFTVSQVKIVILSDTTWGEYVGAGNCQQFVQHGRILNIEVREPTTAHFVVSGAGGAPCDFNLLSHRHCVAKCANSNCYLAGLSEQVCVQGEQTSTVDKYLSTSGHYLVWRETYPTWQLGRLIGYTWSYD